MEIRLDQLVSAEAGHGAGVLIRAIEPVAGHERMRARRATDAERQWCSGPGKLAQAMGVTHALNSQPLDAPPFLLTARAATPAVVAGPRIGISKAVELPWRFGLAGSAFLSRPLRA